MVARKIAFSFRIDMSVDFHARRTTSSSSWSSGITKSPSTAARSARIVAVSAGRLLQRRTPDLDVRGSCP